VPSGDQMHRFEVKRPSQTAALLCAAAILGSCGEDEGSVPSACSEGPAAVRSALRDAPRPVHLDGVPLSECLGKGASGGELQAVGISFVEAAAGLAPAARREPEGRAALELGYLVGSARRGGGSTQGVHDELLRRLDQELAGVDTRSEAFRRGERAGRNGG
jgi:hypothetical protein